MNGYMKGEVVIYQESSITADGSIVQSGDDTTIHRRSSKNIGIDAESVLFGILKALK